MIIRTKHTFDFFFFLPTSYLYRNNHKQQALTRSHSHTYKHEKFWVKLWINEYKNKQTNKNEKQTHGILRLENRTFLYLYLFLVKHKHIDLNNNRPSPQSFSSFFYHLFVYFSYTVSFCYFNVLRFYYSPITPNDIIRYSQI